MHQPINERVTNLVATRQETTQAQAASVVLNNNNNNNNLALAPLIKQEGQLVEEGQPRAQEAGLGLELAERGLNIAIETSEPPGLERGEVGPKLEIADGAPLVCRTCNRVSRRWKALRRP